MIARHRAIAANPAVHRGASERLFERILVDAREPSCNEAGASEPKVLMLVNRLIHQRSCGGGITSYLRQVQGILQDRIARRHLGERSVLTGDQIVLLKQFPQQLSRDRAQRRWRRLRIALRARWLFLDLYTEVVHRPGNSGFKRARNEFEDTVLQATQPPLITMSSSGSEGAEELEQILASWRLREARLLERLRDAETRAERAEEALKADGLGMAW
jgi:hypothetical protein